MADRTSTEPHKRAYHSPERRRQAEETRRRILDAARELFMSAGYAGTTVEAVATAAGVSPKTVSAVFGSKREMLAALVSFTAFGRHFQEIRGHFLAVSDPRRRVELAAQLTRQAYETLAPEFDLLRGVHAVAPELADLARQVGARRRQNLTYLVVYLRERGVLHGGLSQEDATDVGVGADQLRSVSRAGHRVWLGARSLRNVVGGRAHPTSARAAGRQRETRMRLISRRLGPRMATAIERRIESRRRRHFALA